MRPFLKSLSITGLLLCLPFIQSVSAQSIKDIQEYCQSMSGSGISDEDAKAFIADCIAEQSSYLEQDSLQEQYEDSSGYEESNSYEDSYQEPQYEQEDYGQEQNCYAKVDDNIQKLLDNDLNAAFDYDQLVDQCLKGNL
tara:strand:+ start:1959 stop:2375 length:417 start_codon:yes stop_codon:yes gene_type:complete